MAALDGWALVPIQEFVHVALRHLSRLWTTERQSLVVSNWHHHTLVGGAGNVI